MRAFQDEHGFGGDDPGRDAGGRAHGHVIGGETWPALARPVRAGAGGEAQQAVEALLRGRDLRLPDVVTPEIWQHLLTR